NGICLCANAVKAGKAVTAPPRNVMNSRRLIAAPDSPRHLSTPLFDGQMPPRADATLSRQRRRGTGNAPVISVRSESIRGPRVRTNFFLRHSTALHSFRPVL